MNIKLRDNLHELKQKLLQNVLCISDTHFGHVKVFEKFEPIRKTYTLSKGKQTLKDFEDLMVENWNETVFDSDTLIHLGDVCIDKMNPTKTEENLAISLKLEGESLILIKGNHDKSDNSLYYQNGWNFVIDCPVILLDNPKIIDNAPGLAHCIIIDINGKRVMFSHFGIHQYNENFEGKYREPFRYLTKLYNDYKCDYNIHGHSHSNAINSEKSFNCSVEVINFTPKKLTDIFAVLTKFKNKLL